MSLTTAMIETDSIAQEMLAKYKIPMPDQNASDEEISGYLAYFKWADRNLRPLGQTQPQPRIGSMPSSSNTFSVSATVTPPVRIRAQRQDASPFRSAVPRA
jgi:nitrite reductase (NO-forming)